MAFEKKLIRYIRDISEPLEPLAVNIKTELKKLRNIEAVIFDVYGTLFVSGSGDISLASDRNIKEQIKKIIDNAGIKIKYGFDPENLEELFRTEIKYEHDRKKKEGYPYPEVNVQEIWMRVFRRISENNEKDLLRKIPEFAVYYECAVNPVWPMRNSENIIDYLNRKKLVTGIVSNAQFYTPLLFPAFFAKTPEGLGFRRNLCIWSWEQQRSKPDTKLFLNLLTTLNECYNIESSRTLYIGNDMLNDIRAAGECGLKTVLFAGDERSLRLRSGNELCRKTKPDCVITDLKQLREIV